VPLKWASTSAEEIGLAGLALSRWITESLRPLEGHFERVSSGHRAVAARVNSTIISVPYATFVAHLQLIIISAVLIRGDQTFTAVHLSPLWIQVNEELSKICYEYDRLRLQAMIGAPKVLLVKAGTFQQYREVMIGKGTSPTQFKMPRVVRLPDMLQLLRGNVK